MNFLKSILLLALGTLISVSLQAQDAPTQDKSGIGPRIGYYQAPDAEDGALFFGVQSRVRGKSIIGAELAAEFRGQQTYDVDGGTVKVRQIPVTASLLLFVPIAPNFQPYGLAGLGAYYTIYDYEGGFLNQGDEAEVNLGYHLGFGLELPIDETVALNIDYRYLYLDGSNDDFGDKKYSGNVISGGITFYF